MVLLRSGSSLKLQYDYILMILFCFSVPYVSSQWVTPWELRSFTLLMVASIRSTRCVSSSGWARSTSAPAAGSTNSLTWSTRPFYPTLHRGPPTFCFNKGDDASNLFLKKRIKEDPSNNPVKRYLPIIEKKTLIKRFVVRRTKHTEYFSHKLNHGV